MWYLARASCLTRRHVAAIHGSNEQGEYFSSGYAAFSRLNRDINYLLYFTLLYCWTTTDLSTKTDRHRADLPWTRFAPESVPRSVLILFTILALGLDFTNVDRHCHGVCLCDW